MIGPGVTLCADKKMPSAYGKLIDRHIQRRTIRFASRRDVGHDADDGHHIADERCRQADSDGLPSAEQVAHEGPVHDGHARSAVGISAGELTAGSNGDPDGIEVIATDRPQSRWRTQRPFTQHAHRRAQACHLRGESHRYRHRLDARKHLAVCNQLPKQLSSVPMERSA
jgi:hypothetical protein